MLENRLAESIIHERPKQIGRKEQSYDELINQLLEKKRVDSLDRGFETLRSSESINP